MYRRQFLQSIAGVGLSTVLAHRAGAQMPGMPGFAGGRQATNRLAWPTGQPLRAIAPLPNASATSDAFAATLTAAPWFAPLVPGATTALWGYGNAFPGPLIELVEGQRVRIDFANRLGLDTTVHWHGLPVPPGQDGSPMDPVAPGADRAYEFDVPAGSAGTYWYHPHAHRTVTAQVAHGLAAPLIVRSADDPLAGLPERTLMISALTLDQNGQVAVAGAAMGGMAGMGAMAGTGGATVLVNGQCLPVHTMAPGATERWRILNATADRYLRIALDGHRFAVVGTDGGLLGAPLEEQSEWLLAPAQRVEIAVTIAARPSSRYVLRDLGYGGGMGAGAGVELMSVATGAAPAAEPFVLPAVLRPVADLGAPEVRQRVVLSGAGMGIMGPFLINGRSFDMDRVDLSTVAGRVELWDIVNETFMDHPIHIHGTQFQLVSRTVAGTESPAAWPAWLDTVNVPAGQTATIKIRQMMPGLRMFHCHILPHEDAGMMGVLEVRAG